MRPAFRIIASLLSLALVVQVGLAGYGSFNAIDKADDGASVTKKAIENGFDPHGVVGTIVVLLLVVLLVVALVGRIRIGIATLLLVLGIVQMLLAWGGTSAAWVGFFHGVNALALAGIAGWLAGVEWRERSAAT